MTIAIIASIIVVAGLVTIIAILDSALEKSRAERDEADRRAQDAENRIEIYRRHAQRCVDERNDAVNAMRIMAQEKQWQSIVSRLHGAFNWHVPGGSA